MVRAEEAYIVGQNVKDSVEHIGHINSLNPRPQIHCGSRHKSYIIPGYDSQISYKDQSTDILWQMKKEIQLSGMQRKKNILSC